MFSTLQRNPKVKLPVIDVLENLFSSCDLIWHLRPICQGHRVIYSDLYIDLSDKQIDALVLKCVLLNGHIDN